MVRTAMGLVLCAAVVAGDDLRTARKLLAGKDVADRLRGIEMLVKLDSPGAIQALENAIKRSTRQMDRLSVALDRIDTKWIDAYFKVLQLTLGGYVGTPELRAARRTEASLKRELDRLEHDLRLHMQIVKNAGEAFARLRSPEAVEKIARGATSEPNPLARMMYITGLGHESRATALPTLLELAEHKDGRVRAAVARTLAHFPREPGVLERARVLAEDRLWAVRLGAYQVFAGAPFAVAVEELVRAAVREDGELAVAVDTYLEGLTGRSFAQKPKRWNLWWKQNAGAIRAGTWRRPPATATDKEERTFARFFRIPIQSERLVFALDFSGSMEEELKVKDAEIRKMLRQHSLEETRLGYAQAEFIRAINAMPDGALFNIVGYSTNAKRFSGRLVKLTRSTRARAIRWVKRLKTGDLTNIYAALSESFRDYLSASGAARVRDLPDTVIFLTDGIATRGRFKDTRSLRDLVQVWNRPLDIVIHTVGIGRGHDRDLLRSLAKDTGGYYVDVDKGLKDLKPRRRPMPPAIAAARERQERLLEETKATAARLAADDPGKRREAAEQLGALGPRASVAIPALVAVLADDEEVVRAAATRALIAIGVRSLPALAEAVTSDDAETVIGASRALASFGAGARSALPALQKATTHSDPRAVDAARKAMAAIGQ